MKTAYEYVQIADMALSGLSEPGNMSMERLQAIGMLSMELAKFVYNVELSPTSPGARSGALVKNTVMDKCPELVELMNNREARLAKQRAEGR